MTLHTPLTVTERHRHSYDVFPDSGRTQPFGSGATCYYNYIDLQIRNDTELPAQLAVELTDTHLCGEWRGLHPGRLHYEVYEKKHWITQEYWGGYVRHNEIWRKAYVREEPIGTSGVSAELQAPGSDTVGCRKGRNAYIMLADELITENHAVMMYSPMLPESYEN